MSHKAMNAFPWASPDAVAGMTIPQLLNAFCDKPPGGPERATTFEEYQDAVARSKAAEREWDR